MGNCWGDPAEDVQDPSTTGNLSAGTSQTSQTTSFASSGYVSSKSQYSVTSSETAYPGQILPAPNLREFSFQELKAATRNFKADTLLGEGGFGKVYKGWLEAKQPSKSGSGLAVAIKKLNSESCQGLEEWQSEVNFLGRLSHPNLVKLLGYCWEDDELLLVYEFMQRGSLENHLFGRGSTVQPLSWDLRLKIAIGAARGLAFLHTSNDRVIYRDIKASNILLDSSYNAKISDFGLAKLGPSASQSHVTTRVIGTYGYAAPEYLATGHLYVKSDVYGFGVVLVEILTGLRAVDPSRPSGKQSLVDWIKPYLSDKKKLKHIMDTRLQGKYPSKAAIGIAELALKCLAQEPKNRPSMQEVLQTLEKFEGMDEKPKVSRRNSTGAAVRPQRHHRQNGIRSQESSLQNRSQDLNLRIRECLLNGHWQEAVFCYVGITRSGVQLSDSALFPSVIKASSQISFKQGQLMHACSIKRGYDAFSSAGNSILDFYMKWGAPNLALSVFNSMSSRDSVSWNIVIHGHLDHGALEAGLRLFIQARVSGFEPNVSTLVLVAQAYRELYDFDGGQKLHGYMFKSGVFGVLSLQNSLLGMYASFDTEIARQLFDKMCERDVISWSLMIGAYVHNEEPLLALQIFKDMRVEPDGLTVVSALRASGNLGDTNTGRSLHGCVVSRGHDGDVFVPNSLIDMYSRCKDPISALRVFNEMGIKNIVSWNSVLSGLVHNEMHQDALTIANSMLKTEVETDEVTLVNLLQLCKHFSGSNQCKLIHCRVIRCRYDSNPLVLSSLIDAYAKCNLIGHAWSLFRRTEEQDTVAWATMIGGFAYCGMPDEAVAVFRQVIEIGERITNPVVVLNLIEACSVSAELRKSKWAHGIAIRSGLAAEISVGTAIVDMYSKCGAVEEARRAFDHMPQKNIMSWSAMISAYGMNGQAQDALALVSEMKRYRVKPNSVTALSVLAACSHGGLVSSGLSFFKEMVQDLSIEPSLEHYACVIDMLSRAGKVDNAMDLIKAMPENFKGGTSIWGAVLSACTRFKRTEIGKGAAARVLELEPFDSAGYLQASGLHAAMESWADAGKIRWLAKERGVRVIAGYSSVNVGDQTFKFVAGDKSKPQAIQSVEQLHKFMQMDENFDKLLNDEDYCY